MSELTRNEVPQKFAEWLLAMGCHPEIVPSVEKVSEKCRGQYYMVWRSLIEKVEPKGVIKNKRPQVFCDDIRRCQKNNVFNERDSNTVVPQELLLWQQHTQLKKKVSDAEAWISKEKENLHQIAGKANNKLSQRYLLRKRLQDSQRQALMLQQLADKLKNERTNLLEARTIAESLCGVYEDTDVESMVDKCVTSLSRHGSGSKLGASLASAANPGASSTIASITRENNEGIEEVMSSLSKCRGELLFKQLYERRARLCAEIPATHPDTTANTKGVRSVACHIAALHCTLALEATKNRIHLDRTKDKLARTFLKLERSLTSEACELLVTRCEAASSEARLSSLRGSCEELARGDGVFATERPRDCAPTTTTIQAVDRAIESKRNELKRLLISVEAVEMKTQNARDRLLSLFNSFHGAGAERDRFRGTTTLSQESATALRKFYEEKRERRKNKQELSMDLDLSDNWSTDLRDNGNPTFSEELKLYLNNFSLEKNRKIVLESGEKIWVFESTSSSLHDFLTKCQNLGISSAMFRPCVPLEQNLRRLAGDVDRKKQLEELLQALNSATRSRREIDISPSKVEEEKTLDGIKKRLNEDILSLQKTSRSLDTSFENLRLWTDNHMRKYISDGRQLGGRSYMQYERAYLNSLV